jgi:amidase
MYFSRRLWAVGILVLGLVVDASSVAWGESKPQAGCPVNFTVQEAKIVDLKAALSTRQISSVCLVEIYLDRIAHYDKQGPKINAILELNPDALSIAARLDAERQEGQVRGPLHGIPILLKGNVGTNDRMTTTAGSVALAGSIPVQDAFIVKRLRAAGAILLGKTNLTEFASAMSTSMPEGYSSQGGQTLNPYNPTIDRNGIPALTPGGSGAGIAANLAAAAVGTDTGGSITYPSSFNSLVGIRPTLGLVSRTGIIPSSLRRDVAGPMARTVADAAALLDVLVGEDPSDSVTLTGAGKVPTSYTGFLRANTLNGARIGIARQYFGSDTEENNLVEQAIALMRSQGVTIVDPVNIPTFDQLATIRNTVNIYDFKQDINQYLRTVGPTTPVSSLDQVIISNLLNGKIALRYGQNFLVESDLKSGIIISAEQAEQVRTTELKLSRGGLDAVFSRFHLDALVFPSISNGAKIGALAGYPTLICPAGYKEDHSPVGISFLGPAFSEPNLISVGYSYEQTTRLRRPPTVTS